MRQSPLTSLVLSQKSAVFIVLLGYVLTTVVMTYPVVFKLTSAVAGMRGGDAFEYLWWVWWTKRALVDLQTSPAHYAFNNLPLDVYNPIMLVEPLTTWIGVPLVAIGGSILAYNILFLLTFVLTGLTTYLLCYELTGSRWASFIGGLVFAFCPNRVLHAISGHLELSTTYWFPLYALFLIKLFKRPTARNSVLCGLFLSFAVLVNLTHTTYLVALFTIMFCLLQYWAHRDKLMNWRFIKSGVLALLVAGLLTLPFYASALHLLMTMSKDGLEEPDFLSLRGTVGFSADPMLWLIPSPFHPLLGRIGLLHTLGMQFAHGGWTEGIVYLGIIPCCLSWWGTRSKRHETRMFVVLALVALVLSLGPLLKFGGELVQYTVEGKTSYIVLPYALVKSLPGLRLGRTPGRLVLTAMFSISVLSSYGVANILRRFTDKRIEAVVGAAFALLILFEYPVFFPILTDGEYVPEFYHDMAASTDDFVVLDVPMHHGEVAKRAMYYQTIHGHKAVSGHLHRSLPGVVDMNEFFDHLLSPPPTEDIFDLPPRVERPKTLALYNIRYVVLHKGFFNRDVRITFVPNFGLVWANDEQEEQRYTAFLTEALGHPIYEDREITVFTVPQIETKGELREIPWVKFRPNWYEPETSIDGRPFRWLGDEGQIDTYTLLPGKARLQFAAYPFHGPRHLHILVNGQEAGSFEVSEWQVHVTKEFTLQQGWNTIVFEVPEGCERPVDIGEGGDTRCLSVLLQQMSFIPTD